MSIARTTPAQKPRGWASTTFIGARRGVAARRDDDEAALGAI